MESLSNRDLLNRFVGKSRVWILKKRFCKRDLFNRMQDYLNSEKSNVFQHPKIKTCLCLFCLRSNTKNGHCYVIE